MFHVCLCYVVVSVSCSIVITCLEMADLLAVVCGVHSCAYVLCLCHFPIWCSGSSFGYLIVSIPGLLLPL